MAIGMDPKAFFFPDGDLGQDILTAMPRDPKIANNIVSVGMVFLDVGFEGDVQPRGVDQEIEPDLEVCADHITGFFSKIEYQVLCHAGDVRKN